MSKYISYSLWGSNKVYTYGMIENVLIAKELYKGWTVRIHYNNTVPNEIIEWLKTQENVTLIHHDDMKTKASNMFWRFEDLFLKDAVVLIRDSDSRISEREVTCVNEWLQSNKDFHIIRDHKYHTVPILGCSTGCRNNCLEYLGIPNGNGNVNACPIHFEKGIDFMKRFLESIPTNMDRYNIDQIFLAQYVYKYIVCNAYIHCSHNTYEPFCKKMNPVETGFIGEISMDFKNATRIFNDSSEVFERIPEY